MQVFMYCDEFGRYFVTITENNNMPYFYRHIKMK